MADSNYYKRQYNTYKAQVKSLEDDIRDLEKVRSVLTDNFYDEQSNVNKEIEQLMDDLKKSVRHDVSFSTTASGHNSNKEKGVTAEPTLNSALSSIDSELASLRSKKSTAERNRDNNYNSYKTKQREEREAILDKIF